MGHWLNMGARLGALDRERAGDVGDGVPTPAEALAARNRWIRTMQAVRDVAALVASDNSAIREIMTRLDEAERVADRRASTGDDSEGDVPDLGRRRPRPVALRPRLRPPRSDAR